MKKLLLALALLLLLPGGYAHAQAFCQNGACTYTSLEPLPLPGGGVIDATSFPGYVSTAFKLLLASGATIAVVMLILGAMTYMFSDVVSNKKNALDRIRGSMWAIVLLVSSYLILNTINPDLVTFKLNLAPIPTTPGQPANGNPVRTTQPNNTVTTGTVNTAVQNAVCPGSSDCSTTSNYIVYDPAANTVQAQMDRNRFISDCETARRDSRTNTDRVGKVSTFPGSLVNASGLTGAACVLQ